MGGGEKMRIAKTQIKFMKNCQKKRCRYISSNMTKEEIEIAEYLVERKFAQSTGDKVKEYYLTQEGKAYLYEYIDMKHQRWMTTGIAVLALIVSVISIVTQLL